MTATQRPRARGNLTARPNIQAWGKEYTGEDVWEAALARVRHAYDHFDHVMVSFSGGKDSTAVLGVALEVARERDAGPLRVVFFDEECITMETEAYVRRVAGRDDVALEWLCLPVEHRNACSLEEPHWWPWAPEARDVWVRDLPGEAITELDGFPVWPVEDRLSVPQTSDWLCARPERDGRTAVLMGIRADESLTRHKAVANRRRENYVIPVRCGVAKVYPVYDWSTADVWTAPATFGWDHNETYDVMAMHGLTPTQQRCAPPFGEEPMGQLSLWAACFPEMWDRMVSRVPGARTAALYSRTELYSYGEVVRPAEGQTWQAFIVELLEKHPPDVRRQVAAKVRQTLRRHYRKTPDPILPTARHPVSGISWEWLAMIAHRGDLKDRRMMMEAIRRDVREEVAAAYAAQRAEIEGAP